MSAPWGVELNQNILSFIKSNSFKVLSDKNLDGFSVPVLRDFLRVKMFGEFALQVVSSEFSEIFLRKFGKVWCVFVYSFSQLKLKLVIITRWLLEFAAM